MKSHLQSEGWLYSRTERSVSRQSRPVWSETIRAAIPISQLELGDSTSSNICHDIIQGSGFDKFALSVLLASNRMYDVFANTKLSKQDLGKIILQHLRSRRNLSVLNSFIVHHDETIQALSEIMFKEALLEMNVALADLLLRCFKVDADELLPGPWDISHRHPCASVCVRLHGVLPLELAILAKHAPMVRVLVRQGANIFSPGELHDTMVTLALEERQEMLQSLLGDWVAPDPPSALLKAVCLGLSADVEMLLAQGTDPDTTQSRFGGSALAISMEMANFHIAHLLLSAGAQVNLHDYRGKSPIRLAVEHQNLELVNRILELGAELKYEAEDTEFHGIVWCAVDEGDFDLTSTLLKYGADPDDGYSLSSDRHGLPITSAIKNGNTRLVELLLEHGAYVDSRTLNQAIFHDGSIVQLLLDHGVSFDKNALFHAVLGGNLELAGRLLDTGVDINECGSRHCTALTLAIDLRENPFEMISLLIDAGADINHPNAIPTALERAIKRGDTEIIDFLLARGAHCDHPGVLEAAAKELEPLILNNMMSVVKKQDISTQSHGPCLYHPALAAAARCGSLEKVEFVLKQCVGIATPCSVRAIQECEPNNIPILRKLLAADIPVNLPLDLAWFSCIPPGRYIRDPGICPVQHFAKAGNDEAVQLLLEYGADPSYHGVISLVYHNGDYINQMESVMSTVAANCGKTVLESVLKAGAVIDPPVLGALERTPLQNAAEHGKLENLELILHAGGDVNAPAAEYGGVTALQAAAISGYLGVAIRLLEAGADVNAPMAKEEGRTALEGAAEYGRIDMIQLLLSAGADIESPDFGILQYKRAVKRARKKGHNAVARLLEKHRSNLGLD